MDFSTAQEIHGLSKSIFPEPVSVEVFDGINDHRGGDSTVNEEEYGALWMAFRSRQSDRMLTRRHGFHSVGVL